MELNEKLARWAGVPYCKYWHSAGHDIFSCDEPIPDFTYSLDACFKWLVPKLQEEGCGFFFSDSQGKPPYHFSIYKYEEDGGEFLACNANTDIPALALCKAIEQLIDKETNGS